MRREADVALLGGASGLFLIKPQRKLTMNRTGCTNHSNATKNLAGLVLL